MKTLLVVVVTALLAAPSFAQVAENRSIQTDGGAGTTKLHPGVLDGAWDLRDDVDPMMIYRVKPDLDLKIIMQYNQHGVRVPALPSLQQQLALPESFGRGNFGTIQIDSLLQNFKGALPSDSTWRRWMDGDTFHLHLPEYKLELPSPLNVVPDPH